MKTDINKISIIIPSYNAGNFIGNTLKKIESQTFKDFEVVIVNDGSIDNTKQVIENFTKTTTLNINLINQENRGEGEARNTGLKYAQGEYVLFLDADDYLANDALEKLYNALINHDTDLSFSSYSYIYSDGSKKLYCHPNRIYSQIEMMKLFFKRLANPGIGNTLIKKDIIDNHNLKFEKYKAGADNHFFRKLLLYINKAVSIKDDLFFYIYNDSSVMNKKYSSNRLDSIYSVLDTIKEYKEHNFDESIIESIIEYLNVFLISEIRGNAMDFYFSNNNIKTLKENILSFMPSNVKFSLFLSKNRSAWLFSLYLFYKFPIISLKLYKFLKR